MIGQWRLVNPTAGEGEPFAGAHTAVVAHYCDGVKNFVKKCVIPDKGVMQKGTVVLTKKDCQSLLSRTKGSYKKGSFLTNKKGHKKAKSHNNFLRGRRILTSISHWAGSGLRLKLGLGL